MPAIGIQRELQPALVRVVERLEERRRLGDVDEHRHVEPRARGPDRIELRIVDRQAAAVGLPHEHAEVLEDLQPHRAGLDVRVELLRRLRAEAGSDRLAEVHVGEQDHPILVLARAQRVDALAQAIAGRAAQVDEDLQVVRLHPLHDAIELARRNRRRLMAVDVDHRKLRARHRMLRRRPAATSACSRGSSAARTPAAALPPGAADLPGALRDDERRRQADRERARRPETFHRFEV